MKVIQLNKLQVLNGFHSLIFRGVEKLSTTQLLSSFRQFFLGKLLVCLAELNAFHCVRFSAACLSLKTSTKAGYFFV